MYADVVPIARGVGVDRNGLVFVEQGGRNGRWGKKSAWSRLADSATHRRNKHTAEQQMERDLASQVGALNDGTDT